MPMPTRDGPNLPEPYRYRNDGIWYMFPAALLPGVKIKLMYFGHPYITAVEADTTDYLKGLMGVPRNKPLPEYARAEVERVMVLHSIIEAKGKVIVRGTDGKRETIDLAKMDTYALRDWFQTNLLPPADLKVPNKRAEMEKYFETMYASQNPDVLAAFIEAHLAMTLFWPSLHHRGGGRHDRLPQGSYGRPAVDGGEANAA